MEEKLTLPQSLRKIKAMTSTPIYVVGGYVRNALCGLGETDIDIAGPAIADALGLSQRFRTKVVNYKLGTAIIKYNDETYEYTPFRIEKYNEGGEHTPSEVMFTTDIRQDALRRDFTCNSVYYDVENDKFIDPLGGIADIQKKIIRSYNPARTFSSDGLRILRMIRIAVETGFKIDGETAKCAQANAHLLRDISAERRRDELNRILVADTKYGVKNAHYRGLRLIRQLGLWKYLIPQLEDGDGMAQNPLYHEYDVLEHINQTVKFAPPQLRLAALMHDVGKPYCMTKFGNMHGHEKVSANIAKYTLGEYGLKYPNAVIDEVAWLCQNHMYDMARNVKMGKLRIFVAQNFDMIEKLDALVTADNLARGKNDEVIPARFMEVKRALIEENAPLTLGDLALDGSVLIREGIQPVKIGGLLNELWRTCVINPQLNNEEWLLSQVRKYAEE
ncbi:MAG: CCA tRNA nucleotidyltransferase [Clostridia bacterium]|nr:CCA tRNA nucleotidyltransferase [Clostridia bacterium]